MINLKKCLFFPEKAIIWLTMLQEYICISFMYILQDSVKLGVAVTKDGKKHMHYIDIRTTCVSWPHTTHSRQMPNIFFQNAQNTTNDDEIMAVVRQFNMMTSSNETFSAPVALCEGNPPVTGGFPSKRPVTQCFDIFFDMRLNKWLNKQSRHRWFETPSRSS